MLELCHWVSERYVAFCLEYPAFLDCALSLMRRPFTDLAESVSQGVLFQPGVEPGPLQRIVDDAGTRAGVAVVQIGEGAIKREPFLDFAPVGLVGRDRRR